MTKIHTMIPVLFPLLTFITPVGAPPPTAKILAVPVVLSLSCLCGDEWDGGTALTKL